MNKKDLLSCLNKNQFNKIEDYFTQEIENVEDKMEEYDESMWVLLEPHWSAVQTGPVISTPVRVLKTISENLNFNKNSTIVDIGSGHGQPGIIFSILNPSTSNIGFDIVDEKIKGAKKLVKSLELNNASFFIQDLEDENFSLPLAQYYYSYNPVKESVSKKIAKTLKVHAKTNSDVQIISTEGLLLSELLKQGFTIFREVEDTGVFILTLV